MSKNLAVLFAAILLITLVLLINQPVQAQSLGSIYIKPDGSISGTDSIKRNGNVYTFTADISSPIIVQKSKVVLDGGGFTLRGNGHETAIDLANGRGQNPSRDEIYNIKNICIVNWSDGDGILCKFTDSNTFIGNYIADCGFFLAGSNNILMRNTIVSSGVKSLYSGVNTVTENNFVNSSFYVGDECPTPIVDRNYWSDYSIRYPNAKKIDNAGIWDTPYTMDKYGRTYKDNHPLIEQVPVIQPRAPVIEPTLDETPTISPNLVESSPVVLFAIASFAVVLIVGVIFLVYLKKYKGKRSGTTRWTSEPPKI
jgi:preprotein translocase subunit SecG